MRVACFLVLMAGCTILCAVLWQRLVADTLYNCTDSLGLPDFLVSSRHWVHNPVSVQHVSGGRSMGEPDTVREGWSLTRLIWLRWSLVGASAVISFILTQALCASRLADGRRRGSGG
jgi:hypothetical protein